MCVFVTQLGEFVKMKKMKFFLSQFVYKKDYLCACHVLAKHFRSVCECVYYTQSS